MSTDLFLSSLVAFVIVAGPVFVWVIRVEVRLTSICKDVKFLKEIILKWNLREPRGL